MKIYIAEIKHLSLVDIIGEPCAVVWLSFCNFNCPWCFDKPIIKGENAKEMNIKEVIDMLKPARMLVEYVHIVGGEPTVQSDALIELLKKCKKLGFKCSIATNGSKPEVLRKLINQNLLDHVAFDFKAPFSKPKKYLHVIGLKNREIIDKIQESLEIIIKNVPFCEIRTTYIPDLTAEDILEIAETLAKLKKDAKGRVVYVLQQFQPTETVLSKEYTKFKRTPLQELISTAKKVKELFNLEVYVRALEIGVQKI